MGLKKFFLKNLMKSKLKGQNISEEQQDKILNLVLKNPELFKKITEEAQVLMKEGKDQQTAMVEVMQRYQNELKGLMK